MNEEALLLSPPPKTLTNLKSSKKLLPVVRGLASQAISALASVGSWSDSEFFKSLGSAYAGVPAATSLVRLLFRNCLTGGSSTGVFLAEAIGQDDAQRVQNTIIAGYTLAAILALISSVGYSLTDPILLGLISSKQTVNASAEYFYWGLIGNLAAVFIVPKTLIALQCGSWKMPLFANAAFRFAIPLLSYWLVVTERMDAKGIDLANGIAPWIGYLILAAYMHWDKTFKDVRQWNYSWSEFVEANKKELKLQAKKGAMMMTQRGAEYLNVGVLGFVLGSIKEINLVIANPFLQISPFCTLAALGLGMMANMDTKEKHAALVIALEKAQKGDADALDECERLDHEIRRLIRKTFISGTVVNVIFTLVMIFARDQLTDLFVPSSATSSVRADAAQALLVNALGLVPDAWRIIASNLLNTYDKIMRPNLIALLLMTLIGIPGAYLYSHLTGANYVMTMFWFRNATMLITSAINGNTLYQSVNADTKAIKALRDAQKAPAIEVTIDESASPIKRKETAAYIEETGNIQRQSSAGALDWLSESNVKRSAVTPSNTAEYRLV